jgi:hypothetical protein
MLDKDSDTLSFFKKSPFLNPVNFSDTPVPLISEQIQKGVSELGHAYPEKEALRFYLLNHAFSLVASRVTPDEPLGQYLPVANLYATAAADIFKRLTYYMTLIVTRESRHLKKSDSMYNKLASKYGSEFMTFHQNIKGSNSSSAISRFHDAPPDMSWGKYLTGLTDIFNQGSFAGGYGGKPWGAIANTLRAMVVGETSPEIMVDTAWTLCHNNGPIFNKGMLYQMYTGEIKKILDVQRSGQIPQYLFEGGCPPAFKPLDEYLELCKIFPDEMTGHVDWFKVEELGSVLKYPSEKAQQVESYGEPIQGPVSPFGKKIWISESDYVETIERQAA